MQPRVALFSPHLEHVGETKVVPVLACWFAQKGWQVDLLEAASEWERVRDSVPHENIRVVSLRRLRKIPELAVLPRRYAFRVRMGVLSALTLPPLVEYLRTVRPAGLIARMLPTVALAAKRLSGAETRVIASVAGWPRPSLIRELLWRPLFQSAAAVVVPVESLSGPVERIARIPRGRIEVIANPVIEPAHFERAREEIAHPWFGPDQPPVILGVGRFTPQKDFQMLLRAFARVRRERDVRLVLLGEGELRSELEGLSKSMGITAEVWMPGFVNNPYKYMARASVFAMSSRWEGPGHVLVEALALGVPAVGTDCPHGPRDILLGGEAGPLVPIGDDAGMAREILRVLSGPERLSDVIANGRRSAARFTVEQSGRAYAALTMGKEYHAG